MRDQSICQSCLKTSTQEACAQLACPFPIAVKDFEPGHGANERRKIRANNRVTEEFGNNNRRKYALAKLKGGFQRGYISAAFAGKESYR